MNLDSLGQLTPLRTVTLHAISNYLNSAARTVVEDY
jgi:hypothetical protein